MWSLDDPGTMCPENNALCVFFMASFLYFVNARINFLQTDKEKSHRIVGTRNTVVMSTGASSAGLHFPIVQFYVTTGFQNPFLAVKCLVFVHHVVGFATTTSRVTLHSSQCHLVRHHTKLTFRQPEVLNANSYPENLMNTDFTHYVI